MCESTFLEEFVSLPVLPLIYAACSSPFSRRFRSSMHCNAPGMHARTHARTHARMGRRFRVFHTTCLDPPLEIVPDGEWSCPVCLAPPAAPLDEEAANGTPRVAFSFLEIEQQWFDYVMQVQRDADLLKAGTVRLRAQQNALRLKKQVLDADIATVASNVAVKRQRLDSGKTALSLLQQQIQQIRFGAVVSAAPAGIVTPSSGNGVGSFGNSSAAAAAMSGNVVGNGGASHVKQISNLAESAAAAALSSVDNEIVGSFGEPIAPAMGVPPSGDGMPPGPPPPGAY